MAKQKQVKTKKKPTTRNSKKEHKAKVLKFKNKEMPDLPLIIVVVVLVLFGLVMILSASAPSALASSNSSYTYFKNQLLGVVIGFIVMAFFTKFDYHIFQRKYKIIYIVSVLILLLVKIPGIGITANGANRWAKIIITFQPSELTKIGLILSYAGYYCDKNVDFSLMRNYFVKPMIGLLIPIAILYKLQNHLSACVILAIVVVLLTFLSDIKMKNIVKSAAITGMGICGAFLLLKDKLVGTFRSNRIEAWLNTWEGSNPKGISYQTVQGLYAIASGGLLGVGLGKSKQKYLYIPYAHNDFIFAIIAEELGLVGCLFVIGLFIAFTVRGVIISSRAKEKFGSLVALGITILISTQAFLNIAVVTNTIPNTGISLPFLSYGNTSLIILMIGVGILLNISKVPRVKDEQEEEKAK